MTIYFFDFSIAYVNENGMVTVMQGECKSTLTKSRAWYFFKYLQSDTPIGRFTEAVRFCKVFSSQIIKITN